MLKQTLLFFLFNLGLFNLHAQDQCQCELSGLVKSKENGERIPGAIIYLKGSNKYTATNAQGNFQLRNICPGTYTVICELSSFERVEIQVEIKDHQEANIELSAHDAHLQEVVVQAKKTENTAQLKGSLSQEERQERQGQSLAEMLKGITGVQSLQTGSSISKPVIHGMHSNRVIILNQGVRQEGQQWGSEHAPEIDPFVSKNIQVIKGPAGLRYGGDAIGGMILMEPNALPDSLPLAGEIQNVYFSNGRQWVNSAYLEGAVSQQPGLAWRIQGTIKNGGNIQSAQYFLANTGVREQNFSMQLAYKQARWGSDWYYSRFHTVLGIFSGSHIGNVGDLENAIRLGRPNPVFTPKAFYRTIERPNQDVVHQLLKAKHFLLLPNQSTLRLTLSYQDNDRLEFDVPRAGRNANTLSFGLKTFGSELLLDESNKSQDWKGLLGLNVGYQENLTSGRSIRRPNLSASLLPNYHQTSLGIFATERYIKGFWELEGGLRWDYRALNIFQNLVSFSQQFIQDQRSFQGLSASASAKYHWNARWEQHLMLAKAFRPPSPNELYSNGVHHGAAAYEIGDRRLQGESAYNISLNQVYHGEKLEMEIGLYHNTIQDFIYLRPLIERGRPEYVITVRGAFPGFAYQALDASFSGLDASLLYRLSKAWSLEHKTSLVRAKDRRNDRFLVNIPPDRFDFTLKYRFDAQRQYLSLNYVYLRRQDRVEPNSDYLPPPPAYGLMAFNWTLERKQWNLGLRVSNALNIAYRDYLNRFRYYGDDMGRNISLRFNYRIGS